MPASMSDALTGVEHLLDSAWRVFRHFDFRLVVFALDVTSLVVPNGRKRLRMK